MARRVPFLLLVGVLAACGGGGGGTSSSPKKPAKGKADKTEQVKPAATTSTTPAEDSGLSEYAYSPVGKRDPFRSPIEDAAEKPADDNVQPNCGPLCKWELEQLKLVAVISGISNPVAMLEAPGGKGFIVRRGSFIGKRNGKVTQIRSGEIVVTEIFKDQMGKPHVNPVLIRIPADKNAVAPDEQNLLGPEVAE